MRYMIAHMIGGDARAYHVRLSQALAQAYRLRPVTVNIDPHLTVKAPFDALSTDLLDVERIVDRFVRARGPFSYTLKGFGNFGERVVYMNVEASPEMVDFFATLKGALRDVPWLEFKPHEDDVRFHATLCYPEDATRSDEIVERLSGHASPSFTCTFDTVTLLKKGERRWEVFKEYRLGSEEGYGSALRREDALFPTI